MYYKLKKGKFGKIKTSNSLGAGRGPKITQTAEQALPHRAKK